MAPDVVPAPVAADAAFGAGDVGSAGADAASAMSVADAGVAVPGAESGVEATSVLPVVKADSAGPGAGSVPVAPDAGVAVPSMEPVAADGPAASLGDAPSESPGGDAGVGDAARYSAPVVAAFPVAGVGAEVVGEPPRGGGRRSAFGVEPPTIDSVRAVPSAPEPAEAAARFTRPRPVESIKSVFEDGTGSDSGTRPRRRKRAQDEPPARPRLVPAAPPAEPPPADRDRHAAALIDDMLNTQERHLLRELQDELARREKQDTQTGPWRTGRHGKTNTPFEPGQAAVNGLPPRHDRGRGSA